MIEAPDGVTKACPFCASFDLEVMESPAIFVCCLDCGCEGPYHHTDIDQAIAFWNSRPVEGADQIEMDHGSEEE
jgi:hypothetical protein